MRFLKLKQKKILPYAQTYLLFRDVFSLIHYLRVWADLEFMITLIHTTLNDSKIQTIGYPFGKREIFYLRLFMHTIKMKNNFKVIQI